MSKHNKVIYDVLYGFIHITECEEKIINSPFFQRLRWIKQLGFANYIFPGAEHNRFAHVIGVMHSMEQMIRALEIGVSEHELFNSKSRSKAAMLHKSLRIAALLHDIGTFPFSHAIEHAYMRHGNDSRRPSRPSARNRGESKTPKELPNSHEHLGSYIIKNTRYEGGLTQILEDFGMDVQLISDIIKGESPYLIANQLMHSDLDADRMDYLMRDSHYTGIKYGQFDREYILANLTTFRTGAKNSNGEDQLAFGVRENAIHAVEDFLIARFGWYSQVIKNSGSAKFDILSSHIAEAFLEEDLIFQFPDLLTMIDERDERFFWWNDIYLMNVCKEVRIEKKIKNPRIAEWIEMLLYRKSPKTIHHPLFAHRILRDDEEHHSKNSKATLVKQIKSTVTEMQEAIDRKGSGKEWILVDIPEKDIVFTRALKHVVHRQKTSNLYQERDPVKVVSKSGKPALLVERDNTLMKHLSGFINFIPSVYANDSAIKLLRAEGLLDGTKSKLKKA